MRANWRNAALMALFVALIALACAYRHARHDAAAWRDEAYFVRDVRRMTPVEAVAMPGHVRVSPVSKR